MQKKDHPRNLMQLYCNLSFTIIYTISYNHDIQYDVSYYTITLYHTISCNTEVYHIPYWSISYSISYAILKYIIFHIIRWTYIITFPSPSGFKSGIILKTYLFLSSFAWRSFGSIRRLNIPFHVCWAGTCTSDNG